MAGKHKLKKAYNGLDIQKANELNPIPGILGFLINGVNTVEVPNRRGYVYVRMRDDFSEVTQAFNDNVSPVYGLPVLLVRDETNRTRYRILSRDLGRYQDWGTSSPYLPRHGAQHSFNPPDEGGDVVWVYGRQLMPLLIYPSGSYGAGNVLVYPYTFYRDSTWHYIGSTGTISFLPYKPTGSSNAKMVLIYINDSDVLDYEVGNEFSAALTGTSQIFSHIPSIPSSSGIPLAGIRLVTGTSVILWDNIYDLRPWIVGDSFAPTGSYGHIIADEGVNVPTRPILDFIGPGVGIRTSSGRTEVIVSGTASASSPALGCRVKISGSFDIINEAYVTPDWFEVIDDNNYFSSANPTRITIPDDGWYSINARFQALLPSPPPTGTSQFSAQVIWNNTDWDEYNNVLIPPSPSSWTVSNNLFIHKKLTAGEYFEFEISQNTGGTVTIFGGSTYQSEVTIVKL